MSDKKYTFIPLIGGLFNALSFNRVELRVHDALNELDARLDALEGGSVAESVATEPVKEVAPVVADEPIVETVEDDAPEPDLSWRAIADPAVLKEFALETYGLEIKGNKKAATIIAEIDEHLKSKES